MPIYTDAEPSFKIVLPGDYILAVSEFKFGISTGPKTKGCELYEVLFIIEEHDSKIKERLIDHPSCSWKIDTFLKSAGIRTLAKGQAFTFDEEESETGEASWVNPMGLRCWAHLIIDESYVSPTTKKVVPKNTIDLFYTDRAALPPNAKFRVMKTTK